MLLDNGSKAIPKAHSLGLAPVAAAMAKSALIDDLSVPGTGDYGLTAQLLLERGGSGATEDAKAADLWSTTGTNAVYDANGNISSRVTLHKNF